MTAVDQLRSWLRAHPLAADALVATVLAVIVLLVPDPDSASDSRPDSLPWMVVVVATCGALVLRRRHPLPVLAVTTVGAVVATALLGGHTLLVAPTLLAVYTVAVGSDRRTAWLAWGAAALALTVGSAVPTASSAFDPEILSYVAWTGMATALGDALRNRRAYVSAIEERAARAEQTREQEARRRVAEERLRIARELHDVVAHRIAVVTVQAGVASHLLTSQPEAARAALAHVREAGRAVLDEMGDILNVLRQPDEPVGPSAPAPGLAQLDALVASFAAVGLGVDWSQTGRPRPVGAAVDLVAYRVLEEALTNAHKHGTGTAHVDVDYGPPAVKLLVSNPVGAAKPTEGAAASANGHGLIGMRERAAAVGGVLRAARGLDGQFRVEAVLPLGAPTGS